MKKCQISFTVLVAVLSVFGCREDPAQTNDGTPGAEPVATIVTVPVGKGVVEESVESYGSVEFDPQQTETVSFVNAGLVEQVMVTPGQAVSANKALLGLGALPSSGIEMEQARINLEFAQQKLVRLERLRARKLATNEVVDDARKEVKSAQAILAGYGVAGHQGSRIIESPFSGVVVGVLVTAGAIVHAGEDALLLAPADGLAVRAGFEPEDAIRLRPGMPVVISPVFKADGEVPAHAFLAKLHRVVDPGTQLVEALIKPRLSPAWMIAGVKVAVRVVIRSAPDAVRIPRDAVLNRDGLTGVFVVERGRAQWRPIHLGTENESWAEVRTGLQAGEDVVTTGRSSLVDGMSVTVAGERSSKP